MRIFLGGLPAGRLASEAEAFAAERFDRLMRPDALERWNAHRASGVGLVIVTASPEALVEPFARRLGADVLIATRLAYTADGRVGGGLAGANCRGAEKLERLFARFGPQMRLSEAYGDTQGDREMLAHAEVGHLRAFRGRPRRR